MVEFSCILAALCFTAANVMKIIYFIKERNRTFDWETYTNLDPDYLQDDWKFRFDVQALFLTSGFLNAFAWICLAGPLVQLGWLLSQQGTQNLALNTSIIMLAIGGALTEWLSNLFWIGIYTASKTMVLNFNLDTWMPVQADAATFDATTEDGMGWKTLEINHITASGFIWFTDAFEWLVLGLMYLCVFFSVRRWRQYDRTCFGRRWNSLSLFVSLLAFAEFAAQIFRFEGFRTAGRVSIFYGMLNRFILMPAWIISLGVQLPRAAMKQAYNSEGGAPQYDINNDIALTEMSNSPNVGGSGMTNGTAPVVVPSGIPDDIPNPFDDVDDLTGASGDTNPFVIDD